MIRTHARRILALGGEVLLGMIVAACISQVIMAPGSQYLALLIASLLVVPLELLRQSGPSEREYSLKAAPRRETDPFDSQRIEPILRAFRTIAEPGALTYFTHRSAFEPPASVVTDSESTIQAFQEYELRLQRLIDSQTSEFNTLVQVTQRGAETLHELNHHIRHLYQENHHLTEQIGVLAESISALQKVVEQQAQSLGSRSQPRAHGDESHSRTLFVAGGLVGYHLPMSTYLEHRYQEILASLEVNDVEQKLTSAFMVLHDYHARYLTMPHIERDRIMEAIFEASPGSARLHALVSRTTQMILRLALAQRLL